MPSLPRAGTHPISHRPVMFTSDGGCAWAGLSGQRNQTKARIPDVFPLPSIRHTRPRAPLRKQALATCHLGRGGTRHGILGFLKERVHATAPLRLLVSCPVGGLSSSSATAGLASPACPSSATGVDCSHGCMGGTRELRDTQPCCRDGTRKSHRAGLEINTKQSQAAVPGELGKGQVDVSAPPPTLLELVEADGARLVPVVLLEEVLPLMDEAQQG